MDWGTMLQAYAQLMTWDTTQNVYVMDMYWNGIGVKSCKPEGDPFEGRPFNQHLLVYFHLSSERQEWCILEFIV